MTPVKTSGSLSTNGTVISDPGKLHYAEAVGGILICYDGSTSGDVLCTIPSSGAQNFSSPVSFGSSGLYVTISAGTASVHIS